MACSRKALIQDLAGFAQFLAVLMLCLPSYDRGRVQTSANIFFFLSGIVGVEQLEVFNACRMLKMI